MNLKTLGVKILSLTVLLSTAQSVWAGKLDVDYIQTSPARALLDSSIIPGGGHYRLARINSKYNSKGILFFILGIGSYAYLNAQIKKGDDSMLFAAVGVVGVKLLEFGSVIDDAEAERLKWLKANFKASTANDAPVQVTDKKVFLKDGTVIVGKSAVFEGEVVKVETSGGVLTIPLKEILRVE